MFRLATRQPYRYPAPLARAVVCALALGCTPGAPFAQTQLEQLPSQWRTPPTLTPPVTSAPAAIATRARSAPSLNNDDLAASGDAAVASTLAGIADAASAAAEPAIEKMTLDAGVLFDFGSFALRPEGRAALDEFVGSLTGASLGMIRAVGHADRLGSEAQNQILSEERAESVKAYLVVRGIEGHRVRAEGRGAAEPVTKRRHCAGAVSVQLISCLQPDRRAGVEVAGTRPFHGPMIR